MKIRSFAVILTLLWGGGALSKAYGSKNLVVCTTVSPAGFDVAQYTSVDDIRPSHPIFDKLVVFKPSSMALEPSLATHWKVSSDNLTYTFYLRKGVKFHTTEYFKPTRDFNADDVVFTFSRMLNPRHLFRLAYPAEFPLFTDMKLDKAIASIKKIDPYTVQFVLKEPNVTFVSILATDIASIHSFEYAQQLYKNQQAFLINQKPIGTGPFIFKSYVKDQQIRYVGNQQYWDRRPNHGVKLNTLVLAITKEYAVQAKKMKAGECHIGNVPITHIKTFQKNRDFVLYQQPSMIIYNIDYNTQKPIFKNAMVRQALDMALDKKAIAKTLLGFAKTISNPLPLTQWGYDPSIKSRPYDPVKAKALLKKAGYPNGFNLDFFIALGFTPVNDSIAQIVQKDWAKIGVKVNLVSYEHGEFFRRLHKGEHDAVYMGGVGTIGDPDDFLGVLACGTHSFTRWCHEPLNSLVLKAKETGSLGYRTKLYKQAQKIIHQEVPLSPLFNKIEFWFVHKSVKGYAVPILAPHWYRGISIQ